MVQPFSMVAGTGDTMFEDWQATFNAITDPICLLDREYRIVKYNRAMADLFEAGGQPLTGRFCYEICHSTAEPSSACPVFRMQQSLRRETSEMPIGDRLYEIVADPYLDAEGRLQGTVHILKDITARRHSEKKISEREAMLQQILDTSSVAIFLVDRSGRITHANRRMAEMFHCPMAELIGSEYVTHVHPSEREIGRQKMLALLASEIHSVDLERRYWRNDGSEFWGHLSGRRFHDESGHERGLVGVISDITERKRAEAKLISSEKKFSAIFSLIPDPTMITDMTTGTIIDLNETAAQWCGRPREALIGMTTADVQFWVDPSDRTRMLSEMQSMHEVNDMELRIRKHTGEIRDVLFSSRIFGMDGEEYLLCRAHDITGLKRAEAEKRELERQLVQARRLEGLGVLAGGIAHDFNNLLQGVFGYISLARMSIDRKEKAIEMLAQAEQALHHSVGLSNQLLTFSKGGKPVRKELALGPVIRQNVQFALSGSRNDYDLQVAADLRTVSADEGQIGQVIQNLIINADQAMPTGGTILITAGNVSAPGEHLPGVLAPGDYVVLTVRDGGVGMPPEYLEKIFDPYFTTKEKGSGLGLAISYSIVGNHGGTIDVRSEIGKGSAFSVYLPAHGESPPAAAVTGQKAGDRRSGHILLMDDEDVVRNVAGEMMAALGYTVDCAVDGAEAVGLYRKAMEAGRPYDIVILDLTVRGGMGGAEAMQRLLEIDPRVRAVVSSGYADDSILADYRAHGFCATLGKPYMIDTLSSMLERLLSS